MNAQQVMPRRGCHENIAVLVDSRSNIARPATKQQPLMDSEQRLMAISSASSQEVYPEGGLKAWLVVLGSWFALFASLGLLNTLATFQIYLQNNQLRDYSEGAVGWVFSTYTFLSFSCGIYIGPVFDKYGPRWLILAGTICTVVGVVLMSFSTELWHFILSFSVFTGIGSSLLLTPSIAALGHWFKVRRGFATGVACAAGGIGGIIFPLVLTSLFDRVGYGWATRVVALICLCCSVMGILLIRSRLAPASNATARPDFRIFCQTSFLLLTAGIFLLEFALFIPLTYISAYAMHKGFSQPFAYHLLPIMNAGSAIGRALPGYYADKVGPLNTCVGSVLLSVLACFCVWLPWGQTSAGIILFSVLFGFGSGTSIAIEPVCIGQLCKTVQYGRYYATTYMIVSFGCLIGVPIAGTIVQANSGDYVGLISLTGAVYVVSAIFLVLVKTSQLGWKNWMAVY